MKPSTSVVEPLLSEFPSASAADWRAVVEAELKGAPYDKKMFSATPEGITLRPIYRAEDLAAVSHLGGYPGGAPFVRGTRAGGYAGRPWEVSQAITARSPAEFNDAARTYLERGLTAVNMVLDRATRGGLDADWARPEEVGVGGISIATMGDLERALAGIDLARVPLFIRSGASGLPMAMFLIALARKRRLGSDTLRGCVEIDPLGVLAHEGRLPQSLGMAYTEMAALATWAAENAPGLQTICVHGRAWHEAGGSAVQELGLCLATGVEYLREMAARGLAVEKTAPRIRFAYTVGTQFFVEIAKLRAARMLWSRAVAAAGGSETAQRASIHVRTSLFNKTEYDRHSNLLRTSVEAFAAVLGGCDSLQVGAYDEVTGTTDEVSERIARNQQLILRDECQLTQVTDPAGGSWLVESLTDELARRAWALFQEIEKQGGMARSMVSGWPQKEVARVAAGRLDRIAQRRDSVVGVNVYANPREVAPERRVADPCEFHERRRAQVAATRTSSDEVQHRVVLDRLGVMLDKTSSALVEAGVEAALAGTTLGELTRAIRIQDRPDAPVIPVCLTRGAADFESLRRRVEAGSVAGGRRPRIFLANLGPAKQYRARAEFSRGFLEVGGFEVMSQGGFPTPEEAAKAALAAEAEAVCICSTDETYPALVPPLIQALRAGRPGLPVILAGYPADQLDAHRAAGVDVFIHLRADALATLRSLAERMGITA